MGDAGRATFAATVAACSRKRPTIKRDLCSRTCRFEDPQYRVLLAFALLRRLEGAGGRHELVEVALKWVAGECDNGEVEGPFHRDSIAASAARLPIALEVSRRLAVAGQTAISSRPDLHNHRVYGS